MSDTTAPGAAAPDSAAPAVPSLEPAPGAPKPSRFRTDANLAHDPLLEKPRVAPIKETPPKDPATGKFVKADPNAGVIPELRQEQEQPEEQPEEATPPQQAAPEPPPQPTFVPVEIDLGDGRVSVFKTKEALENHFRRMAKAQSEAARQLAEVQKAQQPPPEEKPAEPEFKNPFEASLLDDEALLKQMYADIDDPEKGPVIAVARVIDKLESRVQGLVKWMQHEQSKAFEPMQQFLGAMNSINQTSEFFKEMASRTDENGQPLTPLTSRREVRDLTAILHRHNLPLTPENFDLAYQILRSTAKPGEAQPHREQPQDHTATASAAAVMSGRGSRVPDPRAERRSPTFREEMDQVPMSRGRFRTVS